MDYIEASEARNMDGLRLALTKGIPNPFCEAAKAVFFVKNIGFVPIAQHASQPNEDLLAWTGHRNAPVVVWNDEPACTTWDEITGLAERLNPEPTLLPADPAQQAAVTEICEAICSPGGYAWNCRLMMFPEQASAAQPEAGSWEAILQRDYGGSRDAVAQAPARAGAVLRDLAARLHKQADAGSAYFVGEALTAADIYWAAMSTNVAQLSETQSATPGFLRKIWGRLGEQLHDALDPILIEHRDRIFERHLKLPLDF